jgi:hypothetical protein
MGQNPAAFDAEAHQQALVEYQTEQEMLLESAAAKRLLQMSDAELVENMILADRQKVLDVLGQVKSGMSLFGEVLEPDLLDAIGPAAKVAKLAGIFAAIRKAGAQIPTELADLAKAAERLKDLAAGKSPSPAELAPFKKNAEAKLTEQIQQANQTLASKPAVGSGAGGATTGAKATTDIPATSPIAREGLRNDLAIKAGIPRDIAASPASMWGRSIEDVKQSLVLDGANLSPKPPKKGSSGLAQVYTVEGYPKIKEVEYHPGGGTHGDSPYYKIVSNEMIGGKNLEVRVIDPSPDFNPKTITRYQQYVDTHGNRLKYEGVKWKLWE